MSLLLIRHVWPQYSRPDSFFGGLLDASNVAFLFNDQRSVLPRTANESASAKGLPVLGFQVCAAPEERMNRLSPDFSSFPRMQRPQT